MYSFVPFICVVVKEKINQTNVYVLYVLLLFMSMFQKNEYQSSNIAGQIKGKKLNLSNLYK